MIATDKRNAIFLLHQEGMPVHEIVRKLGVSRNTVRIIIRGLLALSRRMSLELLTQSLERACKYRITSLETVERIALLYLQQGIGQLPLAEVDDHLTQRPAYQEGSLTEPPDLSIYQDPSHEQRTQRRSQ